MKQLMLGNKAVARGLYEAGVCFVSSYPGTPSTEITEEIDRQVRAKLFAPKDLTPEEEKALQDQNKEEEDDLALLDEDLDS